MNQKLLPEADWLEKNGAWKKDFVHRRIIAYMNPVSWFVCADGYLRGEEND